MAKRRAPKGTYWRRETLWGRFTIKGREVRWSLRTGDAEIARQRFAARQEREIAISHYGDDRKAWEDAVIPWTDHIISNVSPSTAKRYGVSLKQVEKHLKGCFLDEIGKSILSALVRDRRSEGASNATIRRDLTAISSVLAFCEDEGWIDHNPALSRLKKLKERRDPIILPTPLDISYVISRAPGLFARLIEAANTTGCRESELAYLERSRLDMRRRQMTIVGKGNKLRTIDMLDSYQVFQSIPLALRSRYVFWHHDGQPYENVASRFAAITRAAQIAAQRQGREFRRFRFHDLRHRFAVDYLKSGKGSIYDLQQHLGHSSVKTTEIYLKYLTPEEARRAKQGTAQSAAQVQRFAGTGTQENEAG